jgi:hypothetical protein
MVDGSWHDLPVYLSTLLLLGDYVLVCRHLVLWCNLSAGKKVAVSCAWLTVQSYNRVLFVTVSLRPFLAAGFLPDNR